MNATLDEIMRIALDAPQERRDAMAAAGRGEVKTAGTENLMELRHYTPTEAAELLGVTVDAVWKRIRRKQIQFVEVPLAPTSTNPKRRRRGVKIQHCVLRKILEGVKQ